LKKTVGLGVTEITVWSAAAYPLGGGKEEVALLSISSNSIGGSAHPGLEPLQRVSLLVLIGMPVVDTFDHAF
jgi:hypothetical protein